MAFWNPLVIFMFLGTSGAATVASSQGVIATPGPLSIPPSQLWDGNDGPWSSFVLRVGSPPQTVRVLISTASNQPWVVLPDGCSCAPADCSEKRGEIFHTDKSSSWVQNNITSNGIFSLAIDANLGGHGNGLYGYDHVALSYQGSGAPSLEAQVVSGITTKYFYTGFFGLNPAATNFSSNNAPVQSYMSGLKALSYIPSLSYGYTAGNQYRFGKVLGSLTLGGYDSSLFEPNDLSISFNQQNDFELSISVKFINMSSKDGNITLSSNSFQAIIDSTVSYFYLPLEICQRFEEAFGIVYDKTAELYLVNDTTHRQLQAQSANVVLTFTNSTEEVMVDISLPYQAFDLIAEYPLVQNTTRYFPLKRAANSSQITLGRTLLQEAYIIADYERSNFSIHQRKWVENARESIQAILPPGETPDVEPIPAPRSKYTIPIAIAASVGSAILIMLVVGCTIIRRRQTKIKVFLSAHSTKSRKSPRPTITRILPPSTFQGQGDGPEAQPESPVSPDLNSGPNRFQSLAATANDQVHELPARELVMGELLGSPIDEEMVWAHERVTQLERAMIRERQAMRSEQLIREGARYDPRRYTTPATNWI